EPAACERAQGWFVGCFASIENVAAFFHDELFKINSIWTQYRETQAQAAGMSSADRTTLYRAAVRVAQRALRELRDHPDVAYLLSAGLAGTDWPEAQGAFTEIAAALAVQVDMESGRQPIVPAPSTGTPEASPPRKS